MNTIITLEQLIELKQRLDAAQETATNLEIALTQMLMIYTELKVGMKLTVTKEARAHLGGAPGVAIGDGATIGKIWIDSQGVVLFAIDWDDWGTSVQSLERVQAMRTEYLKISKKA